MSATDPLPTSPTVSVVIPTYNRAGTLRRAIQSVLTQSYRDIELIVVDDASTDASAEILAQIDDPRMRVITHPQNKGFGGALNTGARAAKGSYIAFQDSDDEWLDGKLERQMQVFAAAAADCVCVYCIKIVYGRNPERVRGRRRIVCVPGPDDTVLEGDMRDILSHLNLVSTQTIVCTAEGYHKTGGFDERLYNSVDWDFVSRLSLHGTFRFVDEPLVNTYIQSDSISTLSRKAPYSQLIISNKFKRRGVDPAVQADRYARLGYTLGKLGYPARGDTLLRSALAADKMAPRTWAKFLANRIFWRRNAAARPAR